MCACSSVCAGVPILLTGPIVQGDVEQSEMAGRNDSAKLDYHAAPKGCKRRKSQNMCLPQFQVMKGCG